MVVRSVAPKVALTAGLLGNSMVPSMGEKKAALTVVLKAGPMVEKTVVLKAVSRVVLMAVSRVVLMAVLRVVSKVAQTATVKEIRSVA